MTATRSVICHQEVILLRASPDQVKAFVLTPERIMDYYPGGIDCGVIEPGRSFYRHGKSGVSLLELNVAGSDEKTVVLKVTTAMQATPSFTAQKIKQAAFFTMVEDWQIEPHEQGSKLTKTWRDIKKHKLKWLPLNFIVKSSAKAESAKLKLAWDAAAQPQNIGSQGKA